MESSDTEYHDCSAGEEDDDDQSYCTDDVGSDVDGDGDDYMDDYDGDEGEEMEDGDDGGGVGGDVHDAEDKRDAPKYRVLTVDDVRARQKECTAKIAGLTLLPPAFAAAVLRHCQWSVDVVDDRWFSDEQRVRDAVGLPPGDAPVVLNDAPHVCAICYDVYAPGEMRSAGCEHFYCRDCWRGYVRAAVEDGPRCLSIRCPHPPCPVAVVQDLVDEVAADEDRARYAEFAIRSYVEENKKMRWCPAPGCTFAAEYLDGSHCKQELDVVCECKHGFCLCCGEEPHRPVACDTVREWLVKHSSDSETANWVLANTKHCPQCRRPIEKNMGCMHMTCSAPCRHEFCWLCLGPWSEHRGGDFYRCNVYDAARNEGKLTAEESRREQGKASVDRYLHYYERWAAQDQSRQKALADIAELDEGGGLEAIAGEVGVSWGDLSFLMDAYAQIVDCRRILRWTYAFGYYLSGDGEDCQAKRELFEHLQSQAEGSLELLHGCAERERKELLDADDAAVKVVPYREKLAGLTFVARKQFENLVRAMEDGLHDEVKVNPLLTRADDPDPVAHVRSIFPQEPQQ